MVAFAGIKFEDFTQTSFSNLAMIHLTYDSHTCSPLAFKLLKISELKIEA